jgi:hypothetical protein
LHRVPTPPGGSLDNLLATPAGDLALIECKLWRNPEARRDVIAQIIGYARDISSWSYEELQDAIRKKTKQNLYEMVSELGRIDEASFHDAVSRNLRRGRFLLLIVGDGIREGVESLTEFLQQHPGMHFTLGIVELALFEVPTRGYIAQPRVLARTTNIDRGIVTLDHEGRVDIRPASVSPFTSSSVARTMTITKELYLEKLDREFPGITQQLNRFTDKLVGYDVSPEFTEASMTIRWRPDDIRPWNLGTINSSGKVWMEFLVKDAHSAGVLDIAKRYLEELAGLVPGSYVKEGKKKSVRNLAGQDGKSIGVDALLVDEVREDRWLKAIAEFQSAVTKSLQGD